tara:strand:- start:61 stop:288 length:228 start_codon:yes stop_codon:yes gene_type:complete
MTAETVDDVLSSIFSIIAELSKDIKSSTGKNNIQTTQDNKVKLKEVAKKLKLIKTKLIDLYQPKKTIQTTLDINE